MNDLWAWISWHNTTGKNLPIFALGERKEETFGRSGLTGLLILGRD